MLASIALQRARLLAPVLCGTMLAWCIALQLTEHPRRSMAVVNFVSAAAVGAIAVLARRPKAERWGHALCALIWASPVISSLYSQWAVPQPLYAVLIPLEMVGAAALLDTHWVVGLTLAMQSIWLPLSLRSGWHDGTILVMTGLTAQLFGLVLQILVRRALLVHITTAGELALRLAERDRLEVQLLHSQRMDAVGTLAAGLAHDMNNVLASITSFASLLDSEVTSSRGREDLAQIIAQSMRGAELTRGLLAFSRHGKYRKQVIRIEDVVARGAELLEKPYVPSDLLAIVSRLVKTASPRTAR